MESFLKCALSLAAQVGVLFILMAVGFCSTKFKLIDKKGVASLVNLLLYIVTPCIIVKSFLTVEFSAQTFKELLIAGGCAVLSQFIGFLFSLTLADKDKSKQAVYKFGTIFSNGGYMGIPLAYALFGDKGVFYASAYVIVFNVVQWTYGITLFENTSSNLLKTVLNPGTIGVLVALPLFFFKVNLPEIISQPIELISDLNTPLPMIVTGYYLTLSDWKKDMGNIKMWLTICFKMVIVPLIAFCIFKYAFDLSGTLLSCVIISASAPCAVNTMVLAAKFGGDTQIGLKELTISTLLSIITMPLLVALTQI